MKMAKFKEEVKKYILSNKQKFLNLGLGYNIVGETAEKKLRKKNGQHSRKFKKWTRPLKEPLKRLSVKLKGESCNLNPLAEEIRKKITNKNN